ncbi:unnamed protein product [Echinostoma caproni]|uniref:RNA polymerase II subunit B1 CTD phosphatase RPAP2 homolog n=1 Tax=Echinostoma caproni TaxID=27848 RepID=A0A183BB25_9TREM|nr:unnamed protein product [Echinostoma caproni]
MPLGQNKSNFGPRLGYKTDADEIAPVPPFQGSKEDKILTRKRQALFLRQTLLIAERFSQNPVTPAMLAAALPWLEREQYDNIAVERNAHGNCGYVLCQKPRGTSIRQVYRISSHRRRVYDATDRKPFCSDWCYRAFQHVRKQVSPEPGWCRIVPNPYRTPKLSLLPVNAPGRPGKLVLDILHQMRLDRASSPVNFSDEENDNDWDRNSISDTCSDTSGDDHSEILDSDDDRFGNSRMNPNRLISRSKRPPIETTWGKQVKLPTRNLVIERNSETKHISTPDKTVPIPPMPEVPGPSFVRDPLRTVAHRLDQWLSSRAISLLTSRCVKGDIEPQSDLPQASNLSELNPEKQNEPVCQPGVARDEDPLVSDDHSFARILVK